MPINPDNIKVMDVPYYTPRVDIYDKDPNGPVVQMGVTLKRFTGDLYIKVEHLEFIARERLGMYTAEYVERMLEVNAELQEQNAKLNQELKTAREEEQNGFDERIDRLFANFANSRGIDDPNPPVAPIGEDGDAKSVGKTDNKGKTKNSSFDEL